MMQTCEYCPEWAQWRLFWVEREKIEPGKEPRTIIDGKVKLLVPKGLTLVPGPALCCQHKLALEKQPTELERTFRFVGAIALGVGNT